MEFHTVGIEVPSSRVLGKLRKGKSRKSDILYPPASRIGTGSLCQCPLTRKRAHNEFSKTGRAKGFPSGIRAVQGPGILF